ncbi:hypothetical protein DPEC_G00100400 [Dallia pectoralis]|uniref:Uncharacterized protein n=1 Tax=Dallia pectoralis TaxID=75939 RepID=A0ACC2GX95_DALPE|nr:hypothetical protein DPEC_G00100400 [Dallia pectoralis]
MNRGLLIVLTCSVVFAASSTRDVNRKPKPPATVSPPHEFGSTVGTSTTISTSTEPTTTTPAPTTTTKPAPTTTTKPAPTTTTKPAPTTTTKHAPTTTTKPAPTTTTKPAPTTTTKPAPTTTTKPAPTTTTTPAPTTTTKPAPTTTTKPAPTTTTKPAPITTKPAPTTTKPAPPSPTPTVGNYTIQSGKGLCLMAQMALEIKMINAGKTGVFIIQPNHTKTVGSCKETEVNLTLTFPEGFITFMFHKNTTRKVVFVDTVSFQLNSPLMSGGKNKMSPPYIAKNGSLELFLAASLHSYSCKNQSVFMGNGLYLDISQNRMQAFDLIDGRDFGTTDPCAADRPDYRVAIAVGIVLLILIIIVVVAYLLSRRRRADGYQSL